MSTFSVYNLTEGTGFLIWIDHLAIMYTSDALIQHFSS